MDRRFVTVLFVSLLFALVVSGSFYVWQSRPGMPLPQGEMKDVVVAARDLPSGVPVKPDDIKIVRSRAADFPKMGFSKAEEVIDRPVRSNILLGEPLLEARLGQRGETGIGPNIPKGMRAVTVRVNDVIGVAGFVQAGMHVDVLVTGRLPGQDSYSKTVTALQNMVVLSAGTNTQPDARGQAINAPNVTLLATPDQAEVITLASNEGRIQLVIRSGNDPEYALTKGRTITELFGPAPSQRRSAPATPRRSERPVLVAQSPPPPNPPAPPVGQIVLIRGNQKSVEAVTSQNDN